MKDFCLFACSDQLQFRDKALEFVEVIHNLGQQLGIELTYIYHALDEDEKEGELSYESRFDPEGINRLKAALAEKPIISLALWSDFDEHPYFDLQSELIDRQYNGYQFAYIQFPMHRVSHLTSPALFSIVIRMLSALNRIGQLDYALVTTMDSALPATYFRDVFMAELSDDEALNLAIWKRKFGERKTKLRGLYWGNLLGPGHLAQITDKQAFLPRLEALVGSQRLTTIDGENLFFMLPSSDMSCNPIAASIEALLKEYDLLMQPDDEARGMFNRLLTRLETKKP